MKRIAEGGFKVIGLEEVVEIYRKSGKFPSHTLSITFDGGYADFYEHAAPVLAKYKFPVTVFLQSSNINRKGYMTKKQIRDLAEGGIKFGSNGQTGRSFGPLNNFEASNEIFSSRTSLQRELELPIDFLSYPDGDVNEFLIGKAEESGYKGACALVPREKLPNRHPYILKRINMTHREDNPIFFRLKTWGNFVFLEQWRNRWKK
jgi:peptidoglycan/xylan/chitin deacetylase (PgdA/CDA1 family)